jgi:hypothetical protein
MVKILCLGCILLAAAMPIDKSRALEMSVAVDQNEKLVYVNLVGEIVPGDDEKFRALILPYLRDGDLIWQVNIFSPGGNVGAAMRLGDQIRVLESRTVTAYKEAKIINNRKVATGRSSCMLQVQMNKWTMIKPVVGASWCTCASACFLVWASGLTRDGGLVGIHRLFWLGKEFGNLPVPEARARYEEAQTQYTAYLRKLDVPQTIIDRLFATDSKSIYYLTWPEQELMQSTPYLEEMTNSRCGKSKIEHMSKKNHWTMTEDVQHINCYRGILKEVMAEGSRKYLERFGNAPAFAAPSGPASKH